MAVVACPTDLVLAPAERVWDLLTSAHELAAWSGAKIRSAPRRRLAAGDELVLADGPLHRVFITFHIVRAERLKELAMEIQLPFGVVNHEIISIAAAGPERCRVTFN